MIVGCNWGKCSSLKIDLSYFQNRDGVEELRNKPGSYRGVSSLGVWDKGEH